jgi:hypothetical protein
LFLGLGEFGFQLLDFGFEVVGGLLGFFGLLDFFGSRAFGGEAQIDDDRHEEGGENAGDVPSLLGHEGRIITTCV